MSRCRGTNFRKISVVESVAIVTFSVMDPFMNVMSICNDILEV